MKWLCTEYNNHTGKFMSLIQISPMDPAVKPTAKKKANSRRSLGRELTNKFS